MQRVRENTEWHIQMEKNTQLFKVDINDDELKYLLLRYGNHYFIKVGKRKA